MRDAIQGIQPEGVWEHFYQLSQIPRGSKEEEKVREYVLEVIKRNGLQYKMDDVGNVVAKKPGTPGLENAPIVVLQGHLDMVCEKNRDTVHDFTKDPIKLVRDGDWIKADGTTLGADNGIGVAMELAILESKDLKHGPLEFLFTMDEETGMTGAAELGKDMLEGRILLNTDSEEDGIIYIGCAGGADTELIVPLEKEAAPKGTVAARVSLRGLMGGHSGCQIHEGLGNAVKLMGRFLGDAAEKCDFRLAYIDGGSKHNAIPRESEAIVYLSKENLKALKNIAEKYDSIYKAEYKVVDSGVFVKVEEAEGKLPGQVFSLDVQERVLNMLNALPHGVLAMSQAIPGLVETSTNLAVLNTEADHINLLTSQRSSIQSALEEACGKIKAVGKLAKAEIKAHNGYPGWEPNPDSPLLQVAKAVHREFFNDEPEIKAIHAGLECGVIGDRFPGMDMISIGPTILGAHSPDERVRVPSVEKFWGYLVRLVEKLAE